MSHSDVIATTAFPVWVEALETPANHRELLVAIAQEDRDFANVDWGFFN